MITIRRTLLALATLAFTAWSQTEFTFSDGGRKVLYQLAATELFTKSTGSPRATAAQKFGQGQILVARSAEELKKVRVSYPDAAPVFYASGNLPTPERLAALSPADRAQRLERARRLMTNKLLVHMDPARYEALAPTKPVRQDQSDLAGWVIVSYADAFAALEAAQWMARDSAQWEFTPVFARPFFVRQTLRREVNDPLYPRQWHLTGQDLTIRLGDAWDQVTGKGINIAVIDDALEIRHEDFSNAWPLESGYHKNYKSGPPNDPSPGTPQENHGTYCGGLAAAAGFNNIGVIGVAPEARVMGLRFVGGEAGDDAAGEAMAWQPEGILTHVSSNSWGPADDGKDDGRVGALHLAGMERGVTRNRDGLGTIYAVSAGNGRDEGDDNSYDSFSTSRFAIAVAAVARDGKQSSYSESGMGVAISAFGGEFNPPDVLWSTNVSGPEAFAIKAEKFPTTTAPVNYTDAGNGTSAAAPQVAGAAALLLERNPRLGYRDVKEILMRTASRAGLEGNDPFTDNGAGFTFSHSFGAGLLNVAAALELATNWTNLGPLRSESTEVTGDVAITDGDGATATLVLDRNNLRVEHVEVKVNVRHANRGDLQFVITAPNGTRSVAMARPKDDNADFRDFVFTSVRHWGQSSNGTWTVQVRDTRANGVGGRLQGVSLTAYGTSR